MTIAGPTVGRARRWWRPAARTTAIAYVTGCLALTLWSLLPLTMQWRAVVITGGSMAPALDPGDVVVFSRAPDRPPRAGEVVVVEDPARPGQLLTHRVTQARSDGTLLLKGDANRTHDSDPVRVDRVRGQARLVVPYVGRLALWGTPYWPSAAGWTGLTSLACLVVAAGGVAPRRSPNSDRRAASDRRASSDRTPTPAAP